MKRFASSQWMSSSASVFISVCSCSPRSCRRASAPCRPAQSKNSEIARNLKGHLMLITGDIDNNVHPSNTYRLADALIKANKRFDMMVLPGQRHGYTTAGEYVTWLRADYFAKHLLGDYDQSIDMWEINREKQAADKTPPPAAGRGGTTTTTQQQTGGRGGGGRGGQ